MWRGRLNLLSALMLTSQKVWSYPSGAPNVACSDFKPIHAGTQPQGSAVPYNFTVLHSIVQSGQPVQGRSGTCKKYSLRETRFSGSQKTSPCEDKRLKDTQNPNFGDRRLTNCLFLKN